MKISHQSIKYASKKSRMKDEKKTYFIKSVENANLRRLLIITDKEILWLKWLRQVGNSTNEISEKHFLNKIAKYIWIYMNIDCRI